MFSLSLIKEKLRPDFMPEALAEKYFRGWQRVHSLDW